MRARGLHQIEGYPLRRNNRVFAGCICCVPARAKKPGLVTVSRVMVRIIESGSTARCLTAFVFESEVFHFEVTKTWDWA